MRRLLTDLGYVIHTPGELFGTRDEAYGASDTEWLRRIRGRNWAVLGRDLRITQRANELSAYRDAKVHMFLLPGEATRQQLVDVLSARLADICTVWATKRCGVWKVSAAGVKPIQG